MTRLNRTRLLYGEDAVEKLKSTTVMVVGCGAVGSFATEALARSGVGNLILVDFDNVEESNINRQLFALDSTVGMSKVDVAAARIYDINPEIKVISINVFFDEGTELDFRPDFIIDAIDSVASKVALYKYAAHHNIPIVSSMGAALKTDIRKIKIAPLSKTIVCPLAARVRRMVREQDLPDIPVVFSTEKPVHVVGHAKNLGSVITVTGSFGLILANYVIGKILDLT